MVDHKNGFSIGFMSRNSLFCLFTLTSSIFIFSWFLVLRSAGGRPSQFIDHNPLPNHPKLSATIDNGINSQLRKQNNVQLDSSDSNLRIIPSESIEDHKEEEEEEVSTEKNIELKACDSKTSSKLPLKVFMYDLSPEFHFELLDWKADGNNVWPDLAKKVPDYPGGLNLQHSIEYWLTLDLLSSTIPNRMSTSPRAAIRVFNSSEADIIFVPFFSSLSYNRNSKVKTAHKKSKNYLLQDKLVKFLTAQEEWKKSGGRDHIVLAHHPNSMLDARMKLWPAMFILSDFGRYPPNIANVEKDVIAPYKHVIKTFYNDSSGFDDRPTLLYFQGAIYRKDGGFVRQELFYLLKEEKDVHFTFGSVQKDGINKATRGMHGSKFCLNIAGDTPSSNRLFDAIASHCVPVIISDEIELPYEDVLDYSDFCIFVRTSDAVKEKFLINLIRGIKKDEWTRMWNKLKEIEKLFEFQYPSQEGDAVQMIWQAVARKVPLIKLKLHKSWRFSRFEVGGKKTTKVVPWSRSKHLWLLLEYYYEINHVNLAAFGEVWGRFSSVNGISNKRWSDEVQWCLDHFVGSFSVVQKLIFCAYIYHIWTERNRRLFGEASISPDQDSNVGVAISYRSERFTLIETEPVELNPWQIRLTKHYKSPRSLVIVSSRIMLL